MLVLVATKQGQRYPKDIFECKEGEIVRFGLKQTKTNRSGKEITMRGIYSQMETTTVTVVDMNIDEEFYYEMILEGIEEEFQIKVNKDGRFIININGNNHEFNLKEIVINLLHSARLAGIGNVLRIDGRNLLKDVDYVSKKIVRTGSKKRSKDDKVEKSNNV
jgi:hypothetical protein